MTITATEFKCNMGKYLKLLKDEDIYVTKNGKYIARLTNPNVSAVDALSGLLEGKLPDNFDTKMLKEEKLTAHASYD